jgi:hypothetical protein
VSALARELEKALRRVERPAPAVDGLPDKTVRERRIARARAIGQMSATGEDVVLARRELAGDDGPRVGVDGIVRAGAAIGLFRRRALP